MPVKKIDGLPGIEEIQNEIAEDQKLEQHDAEGKGKGKKIRWIFLSVTILFLVLIGATFLAELRIPVAAGTGSVSGAVVNELQTPIPAEVIILNSKLETVADVSGVFRLTNVPTGSSDLIISYLGQGVDIPIVISQGQDLNLGSIQIESTQIANP